MAKKSEIKNIKAREILDSRGNPTVEVKLSTDLGKFLASVPSGASKGKHEAVELKAKKAVKNINQIIAPSLLGKDPTKQKEIDEVMIRLDGTKNKKKLGANSILAVSIAVLRAGAKKKKLALWKYISQMPSLAKAGRGGRRERSSLRPAKTAPRLPRPSILLVEGGLHGKSKGRRTNAQRPKLDFQEFMVIPHGKSFRERFLKGKKIYQKLKKILKNKFGGEGIEVGYEAAFTPPISEPGEVLDYVMEAARGHNIKIGLDCAASYLKKGKYKIDFYQKIVNQYPILFLEDPFQEEDWWGFGQLTKKMGKKVNIVGDDLLATNIERIKKAKKLGACNGVIIKPNQVGTVTETIAAAKLAKSYGWKIIVSHRSGETNDNFIADLAAGIGADFIKAGAPSKPERMAKYNRLIKIEEELRSTR